MRNLTATILCFLAAACGRAPADLSVATPTASARQPAPGTTKTDAVAVKPLQMPTPQALTDGAITGRIRSALVGDPAMAGSDVSVNTDKGVVVLSGTVQSHEQTGVASAHAQRQDGVMRVDNHLRPSFS